MYAGDAAFGGRLLAFAEDVVERAAIGRHYLHVAQRQKKGTASLKRFFYVLRPAAALRWLHDHPHAALPPMDLPTLLAESTAGPDIRDAAAELIALKSLTRELGRGDPPAVLQRFVVGELERARAFEDVAPSRDIAAVRARADALFRGEIG